MRNQELIAYLPVPLPLLGQLTQHLEGLLTSTETASRVGQSMGKWSSDEVSAFWPQIQDLSFVVTLIERLARHPNKNVYFSELCKETGMSSGAARGQLSSLTRRIKQLVREDGKWPVNHITENNGVLKYWMSDEMAAMWISAISGQ